jgi:hypothetical protein
MQDQEKAKLGKETLSVFFEQFGDPDPHKEQVLELFLQLLLNYNTSELEGLADEVVPVPSETKQNGN